MKIAFKGEGKDIFIHSQENLPPADLKYKKF